MGPTKRNSHQATTASGGPTKRSRTTGTADRGHSQPGTQLVWRHIRPGPSIKDTQWRHPSGHNSKCHPTGAVSGDCNRDTNRGQPAGTHGGLPFSEPSDRGSQRAQLVGTHILNGAAAGPPIAAGAASGADPKRGHPSGPSIGDSQQGTHSGDSRVETAPRTTQTGQQVRTHVPHPRRGHPTGTATRQKPGGSPNRDTKWGHSTGTVSRDSLRVASSRSHPTGDTVRGDTHPGRGHPPGTHCGLPVLGTIRPGQPAGTSKWMQLLGTHNGDTRHGPPIVVTARGDTHPNRGHPPGPTTGANHRGHPTGAIQSEPSIGDTQRGQPDGRSPTGTPNGAIRRGTHTWPHTTPDFQPNRRPRADAIRRPIPIPVDFSHQPLKLAKFTEFRENQARFLPHTALHYPAIRTPPTRRNAFFRTTC